MVRPCATIVSDEGNSLSRDVTITLDTPEKTCATTTIYIKDVDTRTRAMLIISGYGDVAQRESIAFATRGSWVQIPSSPPTISKSYKVSALPGPFVFPE